MDRLKKLAFCQLAIFFSHMAKGEESKERSKVKRSAAASAPVASAADSKPKRYRPLACEESLGKPLVITPGNVVNTDYPTSDAVTAPIGNLVVAEAIMDGIPSTALRTLAQAFAVKPIEVAKSLQLAPRTIARRLALKKRLSVFESERVIRLQRLLEQAAAVFEDRDLAVAWFKRPLRELGDKSPLQLCATEPGGREVEIVLGRIDHGIVG